ncbi:MAG: hypothetical protein ACRC2T_04500, partial [Thermoguttaceae bacterium]
MNNRISAFSLSVFWITCLCSFAGVSICSAAEQSDLMHDVKPFVFLEQFISKGNFNSTPEQSKKHDQTSGVSQDDVSSSKTLERPFSYVQPTLYPQQPFELVVRIYVKDLSDENTELNPFLISKRYQRGQTPILFLSWGDDSSLPKAIRPLQRFSAWLKTIPQSNVGFCINGITNVFLEPIWFLPEPKRVTVKYVKTGNDVASKDQKDEADKETASNNETENVVEEKYLMYEISRQFIAESVGEYSFPSAELKGTFIDLDANGNFITSQADVKSEPLNFKISAVPTGNRPANYVGLSGVFDWNITLSPRETKVGDPLTLTITIFGEGSIENAKAPDLSLNKQITENFKTYPPTEEILDSACRYTYLIRVKKVGEIMFPELNVSYFNYELGEYVSLRQPPIPLKIEPRTDISENDSSDAMTRNVAPQRKQIRTKTFAEKIFSVFSGGYDDNLEVSQNGMFSIFTSPKGANNRRVDATFYFSVIATLLGLYCLLYVIVTIVRFSISRNANSIDTIISKIGEQVESTKKLFAENKLYEGCVATQNTLINFIAIVEN